MHRALVVVEDLCHDQILHPQSRQKIMMPLGRVAEIEPGQSVKVTVDALPEREFDGVVREVALQAEDFQGEAVFAVTVDPVDAGAALLRWGMTAWVEFAGP